MPDNIPSSISEKIHELKLIPKDKFPEEFKIAMENPRKYFTNPETHAFDEKKATVFFQSFITHHLDPDIKQLGVGIKEEDYPKVHFENFGKSIVDRFTVGKHSMKNDDIELNRNGMRFAVGINSSTLFCSFIATTCHEYQHFIQNQYNKLKESGNLEAAKKLEPFLEPAKTQEQGSQETTKEQPPTVEEISNGVKDSKSIMAHAYFAKHVMPDEFKKIKADRPLISVACMATGKNIAEFTAYWRDPHEIDARNKAISVFESKFEEITGEKVADSKPARRTVKTLHSFNEKVLAMQSDAPLKSIRNLKGNIKPEHFAQFGEIIDEQAKSDGLSSEFLAGHEYEKHQTETEQTSSKPKEKMPKSAESHFAFETVLEEKLESFPTTTEKLAFLEEVAKDSTSPYITTAVARYTEKLKTAEQENSSVAEADKDTESQTISSSEEHSKKEENKKQRSEEELEAELGMLQPE